MSNTTADNQATIKAIKGFDKDLKCRGFQFEVGKTYAHEGPVKACNSGFHAITGHPLAVWAYYDPASGSRFCEVEISGRMDRDDGEKAAAEILTVGAEVNARRLVADAVDWVLSRAKTAATSGSKSHTATSGYYSHAATSGDYSHAATSGDYSHAATSGDNSHAATSGDESHTATSGY
jgi:hypothetical protein